MENSAGIFKTMKRQWNINSDSWIMTGWHEEQWNSWIMTG
jgi:hypothetical protein